MNTLTATCCLAVTLAMLAIPLYLTYWGWREHKEMKRLREKVGKETFSGTYRYRVLFPDQPKGRPRPEYSREGNLLVIRRFACLNCGSPSYEVTGTGPMWGGTAETRRCRKCGTVHQHILKRG